MIKKLFPLMALAFLLAACESTQTYDECMADTHHSSYAHINCMMMTQIDWSNL